MNEIAIILNRRGIIDKNYTGRLEINTNQGGVRSIRKVIYKNIE